jgi:hypothetical protein
MNTTSGDMLRAMVSAIWIGVGGIVLWCGVFCLTGSAAGWGDDVARMLQCGAACSLVAVALIASGAAWYNLFKPRAQNPPLDSRHVGV